MDNTRYIALSRQMGLWNQMNVVSNNMANMNTSGYKQDDVMFKSYLAETPKAEGFGKSQLHFTQDFGTYSNFSEGSMVYTGNTLDLALHGDGFFAIETNDGEKYTKKGSFALNAERQIVTSEGYPLMSESNQPIYIAPTEKNIFIAENGDVSTENGIVSKVKMVSFEDNKKLVKAEGTMFENISGNKMVDADNVRLAQGYIEKSNVNPIEEMTKMMKLQRSYEFVQQMINQEHDRISNTINTYAQLI